MPTGKFLLDINDVPFLNMPFQAEVDPEGPQNIEKGTIMLNNDAKIHEGFGQYAAGALVKTAKRQKLPAATEIYVGGDRGVGFSCTSSEVVNSVFDDLGRIVDEEEGLKNLTIERFYDQNSLQEWPLGQLVYKCSHLQSLKLASLDRTTPANRSQLLEFAALAITFSSDITTVHIQGTCSTVLDGQLFL